MIPDRSRGCSDPVLRMEIATPASKALFLGVVALPLLAYALLITNIYRADRASQQHDLAQLRKAAQLQPGNADYWNDLGRFYVLAESDTKSGIASHRKAVETNPRVSRYWRDLAFAYMVAGDSAAQKDALERALSVDPRQPDVSWELALQAAFDGDYPAARKRLRTVLSGDARRREITFDLAYRVSPDVGTLVHSVLPDDPEIHLAFANYLAAHARPSEIAPVWEHLVSLHPRLSAEQCVPLISYLADNGETAAADRAWQTLPGMVAGFDAYQRGANLVVNGGFEEEILNGGFDWRVEPREHVTLAQDSITFHSGSRSILAIFDGGGDGATGLFQTVPVAASTEYHLSGFLRGDGLDSAYPPRLIVRDRKSLDILAVSDPLDANSAWQQREVEFTSPSYTDQVVVQIAQGAETGIMKGKLWIDDIQMRKK